MSYVPNNGAIFVQQTPMCSGGSQPVYVAPEAFTFGSLGNGLFTQGVNPNQGISPWLEQYALQRQQQRARDNAVLSSPQAMPAIIQAQPQVSFVPVTVTPCLQLQPVLQSQAVLPPPIMTPIISSTSCGEIGTTPHNLFTPPSPNLLSPHHMIASPSLSPTSSSGEFVFLNAPPVSRSPSLMSVPTGVPLMQTPSPIHGVMEQNLPNHVPLAQQETALDDGFFEKQISTMPLDQGFAASCFERFLCVGDGILDVAMRVAKGDQNHFWNKREKESVNRLKCAFHAHYKYWEENGDDMLLKAYIDIVEDMAKLIESESKKRRNRRKIEKLCFMFRNRTLKYLKQNDFDARDKLNFLKEFEKVRSVLIHVRAFKAIQLLRFEHFQLTLSKNNPEKKEDILQEKQNEEASLRGDDVIRSRQKRMASFYEEAHEFDAHVLKLIRSGVVQVDDMYICFDHKPSKKKTEQTQRIVSGLLFYFVCPDATAAEGLLRELVRFCETCSPEKRDIYQEMFRKKESRTSGDSVKRQRLCDNMKWTKEDFDNQKEMYHFTLAKKKEETKDSSRPRTTSWSSYAG